MLLLLWPINEVFIFLCQYGKAVVLMLSQMLKLVLEIKRKFPPELYVIATVHLCVPENL